MTKDKTAMTLQKVNLQSPQSMANFATVLKRFIIDRNLYVEVKGKNYVLVEGWEFAGASLSIFPVVKSVERVDTGSTEVKYIATVDLVKVPGDKVVGSGFAICSNKEGGRQSNDEYVIASMAQTRAIGKAFRNMLGWLMKIAGYEPTPAEEFEAYERTTVLEPQEPAEPVMPAEEVKAKVEAALMVMAAHDRLKLLKLAGKMSGKNLTERDYRLILMELEAQAKVKELQASNNNKEGK